jgi:hypothetical protein
LSKLPLLDFVVTTIMSMEGLEPEFFDLLKSLVRIPSVVGAEHSFFTELRRELDERGAKVSWYEGLLVAQGNEPESLMISAHADRHGLVCTGPNEFQYAAFVAGRRSDLLGNSVSEKLVTKVVDRFNAARVTAYSPWSGSYLGSGVIDKAYVCEYRKNLVFEIRDLEHLVPGTPVAFMDRLTTDGNQLSGQLDNVLTVAHLVHLFDLGFQGTLFFTAQEESGSSWRYLMEWFRRSKAGTLENLVVVDTSPFSEAEVAEFPEVVLRTGDANAVFNEGLSSRLEELCKREGISYIFKDQHIQNLNRNAMEQGGEPRSLGSTELGRVIAASSGAVQGTTLQIPTTGYHTAKETASLRSNIAFSRLLRILAGIPS